MDLQHHTGRNLSRFWTLRSVFADDQDRASFSDHCRERLEASRRLNGKDWGIGERAWLRYAHDISEGFDGGYIFQHRQKDILDQPSIGQCPVFSSIGNF
jgi:hypothetical protein